MLAIIMPSLILLVAIQNTSAELLLNFICDGFSHAFHLSPQGICDGAGAVIIASEAAVKSHNLTPLARLVGYSVVGVDPSIMGIGPSPAIKNLLKVAGLSLNDIDLVEVSMECNRKIPHFNVM